MTELKRWFDLTAQHVRAQYYDDNELVKRPYTMSKPVTAHYIIGHVVSGKEGSVLLSWRNPAVVGVFGTLKKFAYTYRPILCGIRADNRMHAACILTIYPFLLTSPKMNPPTVNDVRHSLWIRISGVQAHPRLCYRLTTL